MPMPTVLRRWAYVGAAAGAAVSIAANVLHSYVPPAGMPDTWQPAKGAVVGAIFWPVALLIAIEIFARWHPVETRFRLLRWLGLVPVAVVAAVVSYRHMSGLLTWWHEDSITAVIGPLAVDGIMVMAAGALIESNPATRAGRPDDPPVERADEVDEVVVDPVVVDDPQVTAPAEPDADPPVEREPDAEPVEREPQPARPPGRGGRQPMFSGDSIAAIRVARVTEPDATQDRVAQLAGVSRRTVARHWKVTAPSVNGARHDP